MQLSENHNLGQYTINRYDTGKAIINHEVYTRSLIITPDQLITDWPPQAITELTPHHLQAIIKLMPEVVLIGTGEKQVFPDSKIFASLYNKNIGIEIMNTAAACRTFNILASEGRKVTAGLILEGQ